MAGNGYGRDASLQLSCNALDLAFQRLIHVRKYLNPHSVRFLSCIYILDIPLASGKIGMQDNHIDPILMTYMLPSDVLLDRVHAQLTSPETSSLY